MDAPIETPFNLINFDEPLQIPAKPNTRVEINLPQFPGDPLTVTMLDSAESVLIKPNFPFYKLMKYLSALNSLESLSSITHQNLQDAYKDIIAALPTKIFWRGENLSNFNAARIFLIRQCELFIGENKPTETRTKIVELTLYVFQKVYAISAQMKNSIKTHMQTIISDLMCTLPLLYSRVEKNNQLAESWARKSLEYLEILPLVDANDITKRKFLVQMELAMIYFEMGYTENAISWLKKTKEAYQYFYSSDSKEMVSQLIKVYQTVLHGLVSNDAFEALLLGKDFLVFLETFQKGLISDVLSSKITAENGSKMFAAYQKNILEINILIDQAKQNCKTELLNEKNENKYFDLIIDMKFNLSKDNMFLKFSENINYYHIQASFKKNKVGYQMIGGESSAKLFVVNIYSCSVKNLKKACKHISHLEALEATKKEKLSYQDVFSSESTQIDPVLVCNQMSPTIFREETAQYSKSPFVTGESLAKPSKRNKPEKFSEKKENTSKPCIPVIQYNWSSAGMSYCSTDKNNVVKPLSNSSPHGDIWFGYIAPWILENNQFDLEFSNRLENAKLSHNCIRDITKELLTWNNQNFSKDHPYKFKIVIPNHNQRLYGWIEDCCKDSKGKMHYLICFGFMGVHKTKFFPDPEHIKRKFGASPTCGKPKDEVILKFS